EKELRAVHITGTNGKGSVASIIACILQAAGYKVGLYTSPHLIDFRERIRINGKMIPKNEVIRIFERVRSKKVKLSYFEFLTASALLYFKEKKVDFLVAEVGLGGRLDATNVIDSIVSVITNISLEHTDMLGNTIGKIAKEKACIIKDNSIVVSGVKDSVALKIIKKRAMEKNSKLIIAGNLVKRLSSDLEKQVIRYKNETIRFPLLGDFQLKNVSTALAVIEALKHYNVKIPLKCIKRGIEQVKWPGRMEIVKRKPLFIYDCAHNLHAIKAIKPFLKQLSYDKFIAVMSIMNDKDYKAMIKELEELADIFIFSKAENDRAVSPEILAKEVRKKRVIVEKNIKKAVTTGFSLSTPNDLVLVTGSIYFVGDVKRILASSGSCLFL
ncbi:MAG TPA: bifunctional folylpolyglutamate synthase/dihydrofolate synthase, partial [Candidatus Aenigmarchaeota archaeon]|nr:bifunctional folylpolyglutamate synthase/dihydrofolate synthase [Candidatus Aenigmarchaeota archaeon]